MNVENKTTNCALYTKCDTKANGVLNIDLQIKVNILKGKTKEIYRQIFYTT